jgi:hypothetical protein
MQVSWTFLQGAILEIPNGQKCGGGQPRPLPERAV